MCNPFCVCLSPLTRNQIQAAGNGSHSDQVALFQYIETTKDCDVLISKAVIRCLDPRRIPEPPPTDLDFHSVVSAIGALCIIYAQCRAIRKSEQVDSGPMVGILSAHYLDFIQWFQFLKGKDNFRFTSAAFLDMIVGLDDGLAEIIMGSRSAVKLAIALWKCKDSGGCYFAPSEDGDGLGCPMLLLLNRVLHNATGRSTLINILHSDPSEASRIAHTLRYRIRELGVSCANGICSASYAFKRTIHLIQFLSALVYQTPGMTPYFLEPLQAPGLCRDMFYSLSIILYGRHELLNLTDAVNVFRIVVRLLFHLGDDTDGSVAKVRGALDGGFLAVSVFLVQHLPPHSPELPFVLDCMERVVVYSPYRSVSRSLFRALSSLDSGTIARTSKRAPRSLTCWVAIQAAKGVWNPQSRQQVMEDLCHCIEHPSELVQGYPKRQNGKMKMCSACHAVAYCSFDCQKIDWRSRHRDECTLIRSASASYPRVPLRLQKNIAFFVQSMMQTHLEMFERFHAKENRAQPLHSLVLQLSAISLPTATRIISVAAFKKLYPSLRRRIDDRLIQHLKTPDHLLVDALLPWGLHAVHCLVTLRHQGRQLRAVDVTVVRLLEHGASWSEELARVNDAAAM